MSDQANHPSEPEATEAASETRDHAIPGFQAPSMSRYRPSEAWALRWLGPQPG